MYICALYFKISEDLSAVERSNFQDQVSHEKYLRGTVTPETV